LGVLTSYFVNEPDEVDQILPHYKNLPAVLESRPLSDHAPRTGGDLILNRLEELDTTEWVSNAREALLQLDFEIASYEDRPLRKIETIEYRRLLRRRAILLRRLRILAELRVAGVLPAWLRLLCLPVLPADLRPAIPRGEGLVRVSDVNKLYQRVISRNLLVSEIRRETTIQENISYRGDLRYAQRLLQEGVDALIENGRGGAKPETDARGRRLKSLAETLKGKRGRFRRNLLGKRVDYSGRSVIVSGPERSLHECGLPGERALVLLQPFLLRHLRGRVVNGVRVANRLRARQLLEKPTPAVWQEISYAAASIPILLNRAPTLHRFGFQAFQPRIVSGRALRLHPLTCSGFNADFDGDQRAVHIPLSSRARAEAWRLRTPGSHFFSPATGEPAFLPSQDRVLGCYYLTTTNWDRWDQWVGQELVYSTLADLRGDFERGKVHPHQPVWIARSRYIEHEEGEAAPLELRIYEPGTVDCSYLNQTNLYSTTDWIPLTYVRTTVGRARRGEVLDEAIHTGTKVRPQSFFCFMKISNHFFDRSLDKGRLKELVRWTFEQYGAAAAVDLSERLKNVGFRAAAAAGVSLGVEDLRIPPEKRRVAERAEVSVRFADVAGPRGAATVAERSQSRIDAWSRASEARKTSIVDTFRVEDPLSPLYLRAFSGARGNRTQVRQLIGRRGLRVDPLGRLVEFPIRSNFKEGRTLTEFLISCYGARKGIVDTALRTATAGYLTRRLVDVAHYQVIGRLDCGTRRAIQLTPLKNSEGQVLRSRAERAIGRALATPIDGIGPRNTFLTPELAVKREGLGVTPWIRSPLSCRAGSLGPRPDRFVLQRYVNTNTRTQLNRLRGFNLCQRCYGWSLADAALVHLGEAVGILAAQSIGEPGTQLTRRTFHTGGVFSGTTGAVLRAVVSGTVSFPKLLRGRRARTRVGKIGYLTRESGTLLLNDQDGKELAALPITAGTLLLVREGQQVTEGTALADLSTYNSLQQGELIVRVTRAPHGGQLRFEKINLKTPTNVPPLFSLDPIQEARKRPPWIHAPRTEGLSRLRLFSGEVLEVPIRAGKTGFFDFHEGDLLAPSAQTSKIQVKAPATWDKDGSLVVEKTTLSAPLARASFYSSCYSFSTKKDAYTAFLEKQNWKGTVVLPSHGTYVTTGRSSPRDSVRLSGTQWAWLPPRPDQTVLFQKSTKPAYLKKRSRKVANRGIPPFFGRKYTFTPQTKKAGTGVEGPLSIPVRAVVHGYSSVRFRHNSFLPVAQSTIAIANSVPTPPTFLGRNWRSIANKQGRFWYRAPQNYLYQPNTRSWKSPLPPRRQNLVSQQTWNSVFLSPTIQWDGVSRLQDYKRDTKELRADSQGFKIRPGRAYHSSSSAFLGTITHRTHDWGEFVTAQTFSASRHHQLFRGRLNVFALKTPLGLPLAKRGSYCTRPSHVRKGAGALVPGLIRAVGRGYTLFRRTTDWNLAPESIVRANNGELLLRHWPLSSTRGRAIETGDITSGIPRVEALLETRERTGVPAFARGLYEDFLEQGRSPRLAVRKSIHITQRARLDNVQRIYRTNGVSIDDKHVELIVRPRAFCEVSRDSSWHEPLARGESYPREVLERANHLRALYNVTQAFTPQDFYPRIEYVPLVCGLTKASLLTISDSFLSAASFQETSRVLARAGVRGRTDYLLGLKENLILGTRLPIGTAARHLLWYQPTDKPKLSLGRFVLTQTRWDDTPSTPKNPSWLDALAYLGENDEKKDLL
jgi:DNA-directed RNA polymerase beta' subunit